MRSYLLISLMFLAGCASLETADRDLTYPEKIQVKKKACVKELFKEGIHERLVYPICKDIYQRRVLIMPRMQNGPRQSL